VKVLRVINSFQKCSPYWKGNNFFFSNSLQLNLSCWLLIYSSFCTWHALFQLY